jgi:hypothetical protein
VVFLILLFTGEGAEDSLYWVTYAVQPSRKISRTIRSAGTQEDAVTPAAPSASQKAAEAVLGEVRVCVCVCVCVCVLV